MVINLSPLPENQPEKQTSENRPENVGQVGRSQEVFSSPEQERAQENIQKPQNDGRNEARGEGELGLVIKGSASSAAYQQRLKKIEETLEKDLSDLYLDLPDSQKLEFKKEGEETAKKINQILSRAKFRVQEIIALIKKWLLLLPGANRFFIEQETKIKTDEIIRLNNQ